MFKSLTIKWYTSTNASPSHYSKSSLGHLLGCYTVIRKLGGEVQQPSHTCPEAAFRADVPEQVSGDGGPVHSDSGGWQHHRVRHQGAHDGIQEFIAGVRVGLLFLLLQVCKRLSTNSQRWAEFTEWTGSNAQWLSLEGYITWKGVFER